MNVTTKRSVTRASALALGFPALCFSGCASSSSTAAPPPATGTVATSGYGATSAEDAVREFLDAAQEGEFSRMRRLFGTKDGPAESKWGVQEVEQRMVVLSGLLLHQSYSLRPLELGYIREDQRGFVATITGTRYGNVSVPITAVRALTGSWFVEQLGVGSLVEEGS